jgi:hypothetical protein
MRTAFLVLPFVAGCWPYIPNPQIPVTTDPTGIDPTSEGPSWDSPCADGPSKTGPWNNHPIGEAGVDVRKNPYTFDAGVGDVLDATKSASSPKSVNLEINDAIVTATDDNPPNGTLSAMVADGAGTIMVFAVPVDFNANGVEPGDRIDLHVFEVFNYDGVPEITDATIAISGSGEDVYVNTFMDGDELKYAKHPLEMVEVWGEILTSGTDCGGMDCFALDHGAEEPAEFRAPSGDVRKGDCVQVIAPVGQFDGVTELSMENPDWYREY